MRWFKHYSNAKESEKLTTLKAELGAAGYGRYWILLEELAARTDGTSFKFKFLMSDLKGILMAYRTKDVSILLSSCMHLGLISFSKQGNLVLIEAPILLDLMGSQTKYDRTKRNRTDPKKENKNKNKNNELALANSPRSSDSDESSHVASEEKSKPKKQAKFDAQDSAEVLSKLNPKIKSEWVRLYNNEVEWLERVCHVAANWYLNNPRKKPKTAGGWARVLGVWIEKEWNRRAVTMKSKPKTKAETLHEMIEEISDDEN